MLETCTLAVFGEMNSPAAISRFDWPAVRRCSTSSSRPVRPRRSGSPVAAPVARSSRAAICSARGGGAPAQRGRAPPAPRRAAGQRRLGGDDQRERGRVGLVDGLPRRHGGVGGVESSRGGGGACAVIVSERVDRRVPPLPGSLLRAGYVQLLRQ